MLVRIEKLVYGGEGLGRVDGRVIFVPLVLPGEAVTAEPVKEQPGLAHARLVEVLEPSSLRVDALCPYFGRCGGCHYQHTGYADQLRFKTEILRETLARIGKFEPPEPEVIAGEPWNYRNRTQLKTEKSGGAFRLGYFELGSNRLLPVDVCPISSPAINRVIPQLCHLGQRPDFPVGKGQIEILASHDDTVLLLNVTSATAWPETLLSAARERIPGLVSIAVFSAPERPPRIFGKGHLTYRAGGLDYRVSHGSFFQVNRCLIDSFAAAATDGLSGERALELYAGAGYFTLPLARRFGSIAAVESSQRALRDLDSNRMRAGCSNVEVHHAPSEQFLQQWNARKGKTPDAVLLDPPRAGLGRQAAERLAAVGANSIVYVSCDPATLARDLAALLGRGYRLARLRMLDLFPQTFHIEAIANLEKR